MTTPTRPKAGTNGPAKTQTPAADTPLLDQVLENTAAQMEAMVKEWDSLESQNTALMVREIKQARLIKKMRDLLTEEVMDEIMPLMNTELGFKTDRPSQKYPTPYTKDEVRTVLIVATLRDFHWTGNEFQIIGGRFFGGLNGYRRKFRDLEQKKDLNEFKLKFGHPKGEGLLVVPVVVGKWVYKGVAGQLLGEEDGKPFELRIPANGGTNPDNLAGRAERRVLEIIWRKLKGQAFAGYTQTEADGDADSTDSAVWEAAKQAMFAAIRGAKMAGKMTDDDYRVLLNRFDGVTKTDDLTLEQLQTITGQVRDLPTKPPREPGDDQDATSDGLFPPSGAGVYGGGDGR